LSKWCTAVRRAGADRRFTIDARFHVPRIGRIKIACGPDAVDGAFSTIFGGANLTEFQVWAYPIERTTVGVGDVLDFSRRLDKCTVAQGEALFGEWISIE
jgi:hypothetical protein